VSFKSLLLTSLLAQALLTGCASNGVGIQGQYQTPTEISFAWDDGVDTFVIPKKGVALSSTVFTEKTLNLLERGSYFYVPGIHKKLVLSDQNGHPIVLVKSK
jgi:hypothetical protein